MKKKVFTKNMMGGGLTFKKIVTLFLLVTIIFSNSTLKINALEINQNSENDGFVVHKLDDNSTLTKFSNLKEKVESFDEFYVGNGNYTQFKESELQDVVNRIDIKDEDDRTVVKNTTIMPYSSVVYIRSYKNNNEKRDPYRATGVMISNDLVLTCAHIINSEEGMADVIEVFPGRKNDYYPYGTVCALEAYTFDKWDETFNNKYDIAIIRLKEPIGYKSGYSNIINSNINTTGKIKVCGYPREVRGEDNKYDMWEDTGDILNTIDDVNCGDSDIKNLVGSILKNKDFIYNNAYSSGGQSGSPIFDSNNKIIGIYIGALNIAKTIGRTVVDSYSLYTGVKINNNIQSFINKHLNVVKNVYRLYNKGNGEHFFTCSVNEYYKLAALGWEKEGAAWMAHHFTKSESEKNKLVNLKWKNEGIAWNAFDFIK